MANHYDVCEQKPIDCTYCAIKVKRGALAAHSDKCKEEMVQCTYKCQEEHYLFKRADLKAHFDTCDKFPVKCKTCTAVTPRSKVHICLQAKDTCQGVCGQVSKRFYMSMSEQGVWKHENCMEYLAMKLKDSKQKLAFQKNLAKYNNDLHKAFCKGCSACPEKYT